MSGESEGPSLDLGDNIGMRPLAGLYVRSPILLLALLASCQAGAGTDPRFDVRGLQLKTNSTEYTDASTYEGTIVQTRGTPRDYYVLLQVVRLSDGKPGDWPKDTVHATGMVFRGTGDFSLSGGYRGKPSAVVPAKPEDNWMPARISVTVVGYTPITPIR